MDLMRGVAAVGVLVGHVRGLFFVDMSDLAAPSLLMRVFYLLTGFGHQAVVVFFVLSGFFIGTSVLRSVERDAWSWESYLLRRFSRLYVVLIPALILTAALDRTGMHLFGAENVYGAKLIAPFVTFEDARLTTQLPCFLGNLAFLQYIFVPPYGTNGPLWSLGYEFWSYILFPLLMCVAARSSSPATRVIGVLTAVPIVFFGAVKFVTYFGLWLLGALVSYVWARVAKARPSSSFRAAAATVVFGATLAGARVAHTDRVAWDYASAFATATLLVVLLGRPARAVSSAMGDAYGRAASRLAGFSYTLYLVHYPMIALVSAGIIGIQRWQPTALRLTFATALTVVVLLLAYGIAQITERHTDVVRARAETLLTSLRAWRNYRAAKSGS